MRFYFASGTKKNRWTEEEKRAFGEAFSENINRWINISAKDIKRAREKFPVLCHRSDPQLRVKMNNIVLGKQNPLVVRNK